MQTFEEETVLISEDKKTIPEFYTEGQNGWEVVSIKNDYCLRIWINRKLDTEIVCASDLLKVQGTTVNTKFKN